ncbi:hypothetical protein, partial [Sphingobium indicum]|uniref:hypothetical protein n=1 Tax=Sphingobium indicum TaxID=332055 RepID=UPI00055CAD12
MQILETESISIAGSSERPNIGASIANIGCPGFSAAFLNYLRSICDADHFALYYIDDAEMRDVAAGGVRLDGVAETQAKTYANGGFWRYDPGLDSLWEREADGRPVIVHMDIDEICHDELRERIYRPFCVRERVVLSARRAGSAVSISLIRTQKSGPFSADGLMRLNNVVEAVMSMAIRHTDMIRCSAQTRLGLTSLPVIEARLSSA